MDREKLKPKDYIQKWGGKIGGHLYLKDIGGFDEFLPNADFLLSHQTFDDIKNKGRYNSGFIYSDVLENGPVIVRGSHPNDHEGLVDVIRSRKDINTKDKLIGIIKTIRDSANLSNVHLYNKYEGQSYDGNIRIMIADQLMDDYVFHSNISAERGSIIEHPHQKNTYIIEIATPTLTKKEYLNRFVVRNNEVVQCLDDGDEISVSNFDCNLADKKNYSQIIDLYSLVKFSEFIPSDISFQMEFGFTNKPRKNKANVQFFQARPFKKFEEPTFILGDHENSNYMCFGITPKKGIELPLNMLSVNNEKDIMNFKKNYALIIEHNSSSRDLSFQPKKMQVYLSAKNRAASLEHNNFRWVRKAEVSIMDNSKTNELVYLKPKKIKIISNGINSIIEKIK